MFLFISPGKEEIDCERRARETRNRVAGFGKGRKAGKVRTRRVDDKKREKHFPHSKSTGEKKSFKKKSSIEKVAIFFL